MADVRAQVAQGAEHVTFGDPDFFNGPTHARRIIEALHAEFPELTYDATIKVQHLLDHRELLPVLARTGCLFVTSAVESVDDEVLMQARQGPHAARISSRRRARAATPAWRCRRPSWRSRPGPPSRATSISWTWSKSLG